MRAYYNPEHDMKARRYTDVGIRLLMVIGFMAALGLVGWFVLHQDTPAEVRASVIGLPNGADPDAGEYARAFQPRTFIFPADHGPHLEFQTEWWYYTGNIEDSVGRHFGYQLTFFRRALLPQQKVVARKSSLAANQVYFAHFAITDSQAGHHMAVERFSRGAGGLAGATAQPYNVYLENWSAVGVDGNADDVKLIAQDGVYSISLSLKNLKPVVLHGQQGLSAKSETQGNASYYYSLTRMQTEGAIQTESGNFRVVGLSWMDHEWSTSALGPNAIGWDWYALQLSDQSELMLYRFRNADGSIDVVSGGTLVQSDGSTKILSRDQVIIEVLETWQSPGNGARYPAKWHIRIPDFNIDLQVEPRIRDQQMNLSITYLGRCSECHRL